MIALASCAGDDAPLDERFAMSNAPLKVAEMEPLAQVHVSGAGALDVEAAYLPKVVCCENNGAHPEALKAQAVMARAYLHFKYFGEGTGTSTRPLSGTTADQAYYCNNPASAACVAAVEATRGQITAYSKSGELVANVSFFVDGPRPACLASGSCACAPPSAAMKLTPSDHPAGCDCFSFASQGIANPAFVTYNWGATGADVQGSPIGNTAHESNRGCASQNIQNCLGHAGWKYPDLLAAFYGSDIGLYYADGTKAGPPTSAGDDEDDESAPREISRTDAPKGLRSAEAEANDSCALAERRGASPASASGGLLLLATAALLRRRYRRARG
jgi:hypothetical protein